MNKMSEAVLVERQDRVMIVTLNRPEARIAVTREVTVGVGEALEEAERKPDIWTVILTGAGELSFCAGADLKALASGQSHAVGPREQAWDFAGYVEHHISKPRIAAVNGIALGGGTEFTLASDLAVASEMASFGLPEVKRGILAAAGGAFRLTATASQDRRRNPTHRRPDLRSARAKGSACQCRGPSRSADGRRVGARWTDHRERTAFGAGVETDRARDCGGRDPPRGRCLVADPKRNQSFATHGRRP